MRLTKLEKKLLSQIKEMRADLKYQYKMHGVPGFACLSCGMLTYSGQSGCDLCPTKEEVKRKC